MKIEKFNIQKNPKPHPTSVTLGNGTLIVVSEFCTLTFLIENLQTIEYKFDFDIMISNKPSIIGSGVKFSPIAKKIRKNQKNQIKFIKK